MIFVEKDDDIIEIRCNHYEDKNYKTFKSALIYRNKSYTYGYSIFLSGFGTCHPNELCHFLPSKEFLDDRQTLIANILL